MLICVWVILATSNAACYRDKGLGNELLAYTHKMGLFGPPHGDFMDSTLMWHLGSDPMGDLTLVTLSQSCQHLSNGLLPSQGPCYLDVTHALWALLPQPLSQEAWFIRFICTAGAVCAKISGLIGGGGREAPVCQPGLI